MKNVIKKNQIVIFAIALMLVVAGYMNYSMNTKTSLDASALIDTKKYAELGDAKLVSSRQLSN